MNWENQSEAECASGMDAALAAEKTQLPPVRSEPLLAGERVTWTHRCQRGRSINFSVREGRVAADQNGDVVRVKYRGEVINMRRDRVRRTTERNELTDMVMGPANARRDAGAIAPSIHADVGGTIERR